MANLGYGRNMESPYSDTNSGLHYDLRLNLDPKAHYVAVAGSLAYHSPQARLERARFYLHRQFVIERMEGRRILGYHYENTPSTIRSNLPQAGILDVYFNPPLVKNETALIQFQYQGRITDWPADSANIVTPDWAELGQHLPWFPLQYGDAPSNLTFSLKVTCPPEYQVSSYGSSALEDGAWYFNWSHPTSDIVVAAGPSLQTRLFESDSNRVYIHYTTFQETAAIRLGEELLWALERYSGWYGPIRPAEFTLIESPRALGGGYARRGLVVLGGLTDRDYLDQPDAFLRYLGHEAAHAWWWEAATGTWEDWLNESFAEYSSLLAVRERYGADTFERFLDRKRERAPKNIPLWGFSRADSSSPEQKANQEKQVIVEHMLYDKGPLLLHELAERIGNLRFLELCRAMLWSGVTDTAHFLDLLEEVEDSETRRWMDNRLKT
jgi:hypothetical protein